MYTFAGRELKAGISIDTHESQFTGETHYTVCDSIGLIFSTIFPTQLECFFKQSEI